MSPEPPETRPETVNGQARGRRPAKRRSFPWSDLATTLAAFVLAFLVGALLMIFSDSEVRQTFSYFFARPSDALFLLSSAGNLTIRARDHGDHAELRPTARPVSLCLWRRG